MRISIRLASLFDDPHKRGLISQITEETGIERHTVAALLNNSAKYVSIEKLANLCDYLVRHKICPIEELPAALFGRDAEQFWELLAQQQHQEYFLGRHIRSDRPDSLSVLASDSRLQAVLLSTTTRIDLTPSNQRSDRGGAGFNRTFYYNFHFVASPPEELPDEGANSPWEKTRQLSIDHYLERRSQTGAKALLSLGSMQVNPLTEFQLARAFSTEPFVSQEQVTSPQRRKVPFFFSYRESEPQLTSCLGGRRLSQRGNPLAPGIYYEVPGGQWECCPCDASHDAAFLCYAHYPHEDLVEIACGGYSSRGTDCLATKLVEVASQMGAPQFESDNLRLGLYLIAFSWDLRSGDRRDRRAGKKRRRGESEPELVLNASSITYRLIPLDAEVLRRRLGKTRGGKAR